MKRISINIDNISQFDLRLAKNPRVIAIAQEVVAQTLEERAQKLHDLQQRIRDGKADLFEERVHTKLFEKRKAEWVLLLHQNLPIIEEELQKRCRQSQSPLQQEPASKASESQKAARENIRQSHSELLDFLATQKPPTPSPLSSRKTTITTSDTESTHRTHDIIIGGLLVLGLLLSVGYVLSSEKAEPPPLTFQEQRQGRSEEQRLAEEVDREIQEQFDAAAQEIRSGKFDIGKIQLLELATAHPQSLHAENAYILLADTYRLRQDQPDEALHYYQRFLELYPESRQIGLTQLKMGFSYEDLGDTSNAQTTYRLIIDRDGEKSRVGQLALDRLLKLEASK
ncbi:hypothetical protein CSA56_11165 [candidate division KSB3 bacterium]|uniref:Outer membrane lipoprotein BamD-like domain-containing protein n=1 Tax=candidate division KSB3 bacterium TaxID=2044937 RepID=A0A2G6KDA5_9BACT|nr:MAG: hypothetical protein CSA56_11165 [candidate division KSB3 bacterium]